MQKDVISEINRVHCTSCGAIVVQPEAVPDNDSDFEGPEFKAKCRTRRSMQKGLAASKDGHFIKLVETKMASTETLQGTCTSKMTNPQQPEVSSKAPSVDVSNVPRENMIQTAMRFLQNPQVRTSPLAQKNSFLQKKGLTAEEIEIAIERSGTREDVTPAVATVQTPSNQAMIPAQGNRTQQQIVPYGQPVPSRLSRWRDYMAIAVIVTGLSYGIYKLIQGFLMPFLKSRQEDKERLDRLEASIQELNQSVLHTVEKVEAAVTSIQGLLEQQQAKLDSLTASTVTNRAIASHSKTDELTDIKAEITSLKGLLLNRHQFPATPQPSPIPAWQRVGTTSDMSSIKPSQSPPTTDPQMTLVPTSDTNNASELGVANGDLEVVDHSEGLGNGDETSDMNIHENAAANEGDAIQGIVSQTDIVQAT